MQPSVTVHANKRLSLSGIQALTTHNAANEFAQLQPSLSFGSTGQKKLGTAVPQKHAIALAVETCRSV